MNPVVKMMLATGGKIARRLKEREGIVSGFADLEMHQWMLSSASRTGAFERAIMAAVKPGATVADIGAGTGLLSMVACRAGASRVYAIEQREIIDLARRLAADNGFADRITFVRGSSAKIHLPERVDVIVSETIGAFVFSEDLLATMSDARERFLKPGGILIPDRIRVHVAPVESFVNGIGFWEKPVLGFDYRAAADHADVSHFTHAREIGREDFLDDEQLLYDVDLMTATARFDFTRTLGFVARRAGTLHGFIGFWDARLHDEIGLRCEPQAPDQQWVPVLFRLAHGIALTPGEPFRLRFERQDRPGWAWNWSVEKNGIHTKPSRG